MFFSFGKRPQQAVAGKQNASRFDLGDGENEAIIDRQPGALADHLLRPEDALAGKINNLQTGADQ